MAVQHTAFVLKVLNGFNAGATVRLKTGSVVIGCSMNSDIILHDEHIADQHVQLLITPASITLQPLARPVYLDGAEVRAESVELRPYQRIRLGNVELSIADSRIPAPASKQRAEQSVAETTAKTQQGATNTQASTHMPLHKASHGLGGKFWLMTGLGVLLLANVLYWSPQFNPFLQQLGLRDSAEQQAAQLLQQLGQDFSVVKAPDGSLTLSGYTETAVERDAIMGQLQQAGINANIRLWSRQEMVNAANMISKAMGEPGVVIKAGSSDGELIAQGFVSSSAAWERVQASIRNDVAGIRSLRDGELQSMDSYLSAFVQFIEKKGLSSRVQATTDGKRVIVKGELTQPEMEAIKQARADFIAKLGEAAPIDLQVTDVRDRIVLAIRSVSVGKVPFLVAKDGKKYMEGSSLGGKYFIKTIKPDHVILTNNGMDIPFYYGIDKGNNNDVTN